MIERIHLAIVREVDRHGSLTAAAGVLCLTQSALSHAVKKLEQSIGVAIWHREGRSLRLTQAGSYMLELANRLLPQMELAEEQMSQFALGQRGSLRIGMECHPCYQWLLKVAGPFMRNWPDVDLDVRQKFQFGGIGALFSHEIDLLVTPDPLLKSGLLYEPVFDYELVLVVSRQHPLASVSVIEPHMLSEEVLITYPVEIGRLDIYSQFLQPASISPRRRKIIETTDIMLEMVASGRGVAALPRWLIEDSDAKQGLVPVKLGNNGIAKQIFIGIRQEDVNVAFVADFLRLARAPGQS